MKLLKSEEDLLEFDNGLVVKGVGDEDCCASNYLDFEQFEVGQEFPDMTAKQFAKKITLKEDGFALTSKDGMPKWCQARSVQNGYYSDVTTVYLEYKGEEIKLGDLRGEQRD